MNFHIPTNAARCVVMAQRATEIDMKAIVGALEGKFGNNPAIICGSGAVKIDNYDHPITISPLLDDLGATNSQHRAKAKRLMRNSCGKMLTVAYGSPKIINKMLGKALGKVAKKTRLDHLSGIKPDEIGVIYYDLTNHVVKVEKQWLDANAA